MRAPTMLTAILLTLGFTLSGCLGGGSSDEGPVQPTVTEFLDISVGASQATEGVWFEPGDQIDVEAVAPENAVGNVTYTWAYQPDPFSDFFPADAIDTGEIAPGASANLTFSEPGFYEFGHCDPHPWMKHTVAVLDGHEGPESLIVYLIEGDVADSDTWRFSHEHITVGTGTTVTYVNAGQVPHTASVAHDGEAIPTPETLDIDGSSGTVTLDGSSWMNVLVFGEDEAGNTGWGRLNVYVRDKFVDYNETSEGTINTPEDPPATFTHTFEWSGNVTLDVSVEDPTATVQRFDIQLIEKNPAGGNATALIDEQDVGAGTLTASVTTVIPRDYELTVTLRQGAVASFSIDVTVEYDHTPPSRGDDLPCPEPHYSLGHC